MTERKYFLDWLRVLAFFCLILFHVGCLYASWTYNLKSPRLVPQVDDWLLALHPWRMALLFLISGVAARHFIDRRGALVFAGDRLRRLVPALVFASLVVIPPQTYVEALDKHLVDEPYLTFWLHDYLGFNLGLMKAMHKLLPAYDHLWFLIYLLAYALILALAAGLGALMSRNREQRPLPLWLLVAVPAVWLVATTWLMERVWPATFWPPNDWGSHLRWGGMFLIGWSLAVQDGFWAWAERHRGVLLLLAAVCLALQTLNRAFYLTGRDDPMWSAIRWSLASGLYAWFAICALIGFAGRYFNRPSAVLSHLNEAILPVYILHQPVLLVTAWWLFPLHLPLMQEAAALVGATALGSFAIYELLIRPFGPVRVLFGLRFSRRPG